MARAVTIARIDVRGSTLHRPATRTMARKGSEITGTTIPGVTLRRYVELVYSISIRSYPKRSKSGASLNINMSS